MVRWVEGFPPVIFILLRTRSMRPGIGTCTTYQSPHVCRRLCFLFFERCPSYLCPRICFVRGGPQGRTCRGSKSSTGAMGCVCVLISLSSAWKDGAARDVVRSLSILTDGAGGQSVPRRWFWVIVFDFAS